MHQVSDRMAKKLGGRRRKTAKKGGFYSFAGAVGPGAANWTRGTEMPVVGGRKKRKSSKKTRKVKRGGTRFGQAVAGYTGTGDRGLANYPDVSNPMGKAAGGEFNNFGAKPGDFSSFK